MGCSISLTFGIRFGRVPLRTSAPAGYQPGGEISVVETLDRLHAVGYLDDSVEDERPAAGRATVSSGRGSRGRRCPSPPGREQPRRRGRSWSRSRAGRGRMARRGSVSAYGSSASNEVAEFLAALAPPAVESGYCSDMRYCSDMIASNSASWSRWGWPSTSTTTPPHRPREGERRFVVVAHGRALLPAARDAATGDRVAHRRDVGDLGLTDARPSTSRRPVPRKPPALVNANASSCDRRSERRRTRRGGAPCPR